MIVFDESYCNWWLNELMIDRLIADVFLPIFFGCFDMFSWEVSNLVFFFFIK